MQQNLFVFVLPLLAHRSITVGVMYIIELGSLGNERSLMMHKQQTDSIGCHEDGGFQGMKI